MGSWVDGHSPRRWGGSGWAPGCCSAPTRGQLSLLHPSSQPCAPTGPGTHASRLHAHGHPLSPEAPGPTPSVMGTAALVVTEPAHGPRPCTNLVGSVSLPGDQPPEQGLPLESTPCAQVKVEDLTSKEIISFARLCRPNLSPLRPS